MTVWKAGQKMKTRVKPKVTLQPKDSPPENYRMSFISESCTVPHGEQLVADLKRFSGDVMRLLDALQPGEGIHDETRRKAVMVAIVLELDKAENAEHKKRWYEIEAAHKKALVMMLENDFLKAVGGNSGRTREERAYAIHRILPPNFRLADIKFFFQAYLPEKYRGISSYEGGANGRIGDVVPKAEPEEPEVDDSMKDILARLRGEECQEAEDNGKAASLAQ